MAFSVLTPCAGDNVKKVNVFQVSLRFLFLALTVFASFMAGWAGHALRDRRTLKNIRDVQRETHQERMRLYEEYAHETWPLLSSGIEQFSEGPFIVDGIVTSRWGNNVDVSFGSDDGLHAGNYVFVLQGEKIAACVEIESAWPDASRGTVVMSVPGWTVAEGQRARGYCGFGRGENERGEVPRGIEIWSRNERELDQRGSGENGNERNEQE